MALNLWWKKIRRIDWLILGTALLLSGIGLFSIYTLCETKGDFFIFQKQLFFLTGGIFLFFFFTFFDYRVFKTKPSLILTLYGLSLLLLGGLFFFAPEVRGTRSWYKIGIFSFDPIELTKIVLVILLAKYFSMRHIEMYRLRHILISGLYVALPALLIFRQPNLGSALLLIILWLGVLMISGIKLRHFMILIIIFLVLMAVGWNFFLKDYQKARIVSFLFPEMEPLEAGWSQRQAKIAIGAGGFKGRGLEEATQSRYGFLPEPQTDFVFAALAEKIGFLGVGGVFFLFLLLLWRINRVALLAPDNFSRFFAAGLILLFGSQIFINIGMNLGLLPIIGISLPFVSYGGSGLIMEFMSLGILQSIFRCASRVKE